MSPRTLEGLPWPEGDPGALRGIAAHAARLAAEIDERRHVTLGIQPQGWLGEAQDGYALSLLQNAHALNAGARAMHEANTALLTLAGAVEDGQKIVLKAAKRLKDAVDAAATATQRANELRLAANMGLSFGAPGGPLAMSAFPGPSPAEVAADRAEIAAGAAESHALSVQSTAQHEAQAAYDDVTRADRACAATIDGQHLLQAEGTSLPGGSGPSPALAALGILLLGSGALNDNALMSLLVQPPPPPPKPKPKTHHSFWKVLATGGLALATAALTVADVVQLGLDPLTDSATAATAAETVTIGGEAFAGDVIVDSTAIEGTEATFGSSVSTNYRATFLKEHPELEGKVVVHHAVEQKVLTRFPEVVSKSEMHSLENLRGIPKGINSDVHLSQIRRIWNAFYREHPNPSQRELLDQATKIDKEFGGRFTPPR